MGSTPDYSGLENLLFGRVGGEDVSLARALRLLKLDFDGPPAPPGDWPSRVVELVVLERAAAEEELEPDAEQVEELMVEYRRQRNLHGVEETELYLAARGCSVDDFWEAMELGWKVQSLRKRSAEDPSEQYFHQRVAEYHAAVLSELVVAEEDVARELAMQAREEGADFAALARRHSTAESRLRAGFLGEVRRGTLRGAEAAAVFGAELNGVVGPFPHQRQHRLLQVHDLHRATLTPEIRTEIVLQIWSEWLERKVRAANAEILVLKEL